jgi:phytoene dehydrogenase-like protein
MVHDGERWLRLSAGRDALRRPQGVPRADLVRLARLVAEVLARPPEVLLDRDGPEPTTEAFLRGRGFSDRALEVLFRPIFGAILLDRSLTADPGYFRFLLAMLARGPAVLPSDGLGMLADWTAAAVRQRGGAVETGAEAQTLEGDGERVVGARLADGRRATARFVVLAVDPPAARRLLEPVDPASASRIPDRGASVATAAYLLSRPLYRGRDVLLNAAPTDGGPRVDLVCQTTNITRPNAPAGPHVLLAASITTGSAADPSALPDAVAVTVRRWSPGFPWEEAAELVEVVEHPFAQFRPLAGVRRELPGPRTAAENLILAGDLTRHPSIEGAVGSGAQAARIVDALLPA